MNFLNKAFIIFSLFLCGLLYGQNIDSLYEVGTWQGFRSGAVSFTFDDNLANQLSVVMPMFDQYGFKMTFFTVINWGPNWSALQAAALHGHEIASHTMSHSVLNTLTDSQQEAEYKNSQDAINSHIQGQRCLTIAYPNCVLGNTSVCSKYYIAGRGCSGVIVPKTPPDFMNISSIVCGSKGSIQRAADFENKMNSAASSNGWIVFLIHAIDNESGYSPTSSAEIKGALDYLNINKNKLWEATFGNVVRYIKERNNVSVKQVSFQDTVIKVNVTDNLADSIYNYPITVRRVLPTGWISAKVFQNGNKVDSKIVQIDSLRFVMFDIVPDSGEISIVKSSENPLPVELTTFSALASSNSVQLNWSTATELDNSGFVIERSLDKIEWERIAFIKGKGTTTESSDYSFKDNPKTTGEIYYRLKQIDYNGSFSCSKVIETSLNQPASFNLDQNYPNPFNPSTTIKYQVPQNSFVTLKVYDILGREVATLVNQRLSPGNYSVNFDGSDLADGLYLYTLKSGNYSDTKKLILLK